MVDWMKYEPGTFSWVELVTADSDEAKKFYNSIFDWHYDDQRAGEGMVYTMISVQKKVAAALYQMNA